MWLLPGVALTLVLLAVGLPRAARAVTRPNIILFLADDMGWADWEQNGAPDGSSYYETPNMNRLAQEGVTFTNAYAAAATCSPSRHALMTGQSPARSRMTSWLPGRRYPSSLAEPQWNRALAMENITLAEALRAVGYRTALVGKWHLGLSGSPAADPLLHGFDVNFAGGHWGTPATYFANKFGAFMMTNLGPGSASPGEYLTDKLTELAIEEIAASAEQHQPFFIFLSHHAPHGPMRAPEPLIDKYLAKARSEVHDHPVYAAMLESLDSSLGRILDELEARGLREETLVVFSSDNGGSEKFTSNEPLRGGKGRLYEGGTRVPLVISWTGNEALEPGSVRSTPTITQDLYATLLDLADTSVSRAIDPQVNGVSLRWVLEQEEDLAGPIFWHQPHIVPSAKDGRGGRYVSAIRSGSWKAIYFYEEQTWELYNLALDPSETTNRLTTNPAMAGKLAAELGYLLTATGAQLPVRVATGRAVAMPVLLSEPTSARQLAVVLSLLVASRLAQRLRVRELIKGRA